MPHSTFCGLIIAEPQLGAPHAQSCKHITSVYHVIGGRLAVANSYPGMV